MNRCILAFLLCVPLHAATLYVATTGSDTTGDGSVGNPWRQPSKAAAVVNAGDTVSIAAGTYEAFQITRSGSSGSPITWTGELSGTNQVTVIDPGTTMADSWVSAPEVASTVWKFVSPPFVPGVLMADGKRVYQLTLQGDVSNNTGYTFAMLLDLIKSPAANTFTWNSGYWSRVDEYWDGVEASWTRDPSTGTLYIRFRNGDDPNDKEIKISSNGGSVIGIANGYCVKVSADWNVVQNLHVKGANAGIIIASGSDNNRIQDNKVEMGQYGITFSTGTSSGNHVLRNNILANMWGESPNDHGPWVGYATPGNIEVVRSRRYYWPKRYEYASNASAIDLNNSGSGNVIAFNFVHDAQVALSLGDDSANPMQTGMVVASNLLSHLSSVGFNIKGGQKEFVIFANTVSNANAAYRWHGLNYNNASGGTPNGFNYRNVSIYTVPFGSHNYFWAADGGTRIAAVTNYHNTYTGGWVGLQASDADFAAFNGLAGYRWHNNIFSTVDGFSLVSQIASDPDTWDVFTYNTVKDSAVGFPWWGAGNTQITSQYWALGDWPVLASGSAAIDSGVDLPGYPDIYNDPEPDRGAIPYNYIPPLETTNVLSFRTTGAPVFDVLQDADGGLSAILVVQRSQVLVGGVLTDNTDGDCPFTFSTSSSDGAVEDTDYSVLTNSGQIDDGDWYATIAIQSKRNTAYTGQRTVRVQLETGAAYELTDPSYHDVIIVDADPPPSTFTRPQPQPGHGSLPTSP